MGRKSAEKKGMASNNTDIQIPIQCVDHAAGFPGGVVMYDKQTFPISSQTVSIDEEAMQWESSEVRPDPKARNLASMEEETPMEID